MSRKTIAIAVLSLLVPLLIGAQQSQERVDLNVIHKIKAAEFSGGGGFGGGGGGRGGGGGGSQIMNTMYYLTDRYGPRLTNSPSRQRGQILTPSRTTRSTQLSTKGTRPRG